MFATSGTIEIDGDLLQSSGSLHQRLFQELQGLNEDSKYI